jgi:hypothetical protein
MRRKEGNDLLLYLLTQRLIRLPFYGTQQSRNVEALQRHSKLHNQKGGVAMKSFVILMFGILLGVSLASWVELIWK